MASPPTRLKIFFHDHCFDGTASAALFADFYRQIKDSSCVVEYQGMRHSTGDPFATMAIDGDVNCCVDFRYCDHPAMHWWFDHHVSAFQPPSLRAHFESDSSGTKYFDPTARSCTKMICEVLSGEWGYRVPQRLESLVSWADMIDSARYESPAEAVELAAPAMQLAAWLDHNQDPALTDRYIRALPDFELPELVQAPWIRAGLEPLLQEHQRAIELFRHQASLEHGTVFADLTEHGVSGLSGFIGYFVYPEAQYVVTVTARPDAVKVSAGSNPWTEQPRLHDLAALCERYGGGGHSVVGGVTLPAGEIEKGRAIGAAIASALRER